MGIEWIIGIVVAGLSLAAAFFTGKEKGKAGEQVKQKEADIDAIVKAKESTDAVRDDPDERDRVRDKYKRPD